MANIFERALLKAELLKAEKQYDRFRIEKYLDRVEDIFDYHTAIKTRRDPYWQRGWYNAKAEGYGIGHAYMRYSGFRGALNCSFEHSLSYNRTNNHQEYRDINYPVIISSCKTRQEIIQPLTDKIVIPCGPFFMPYAENIYDDFMIGCIKKNLGKTIVVFPQHNNVNSFYEGEESKKKEFVDMVEKIKADHGFDTVIVCLYYADILNQTYRQYEKLGWIVVSAGRMPNYDFGDNMKTILSLADYVIAQGTMTSIIQAVYMNIPSTYALGRAQKRMADGRLCTPGEELGFDELYQECFELFGEYSEEVSEKQYEWCNRWGGFDSVKTPEEINLILAFAKELGKGNTSDSRVQSIIKKKKYEPIRGIVEESLTLRKAK